MKDLREEVGNKACILGKIVKSRMKWAGRKFFIPSMIAGTLAVIGCDSLLFYARISLDKDLSCTR